MDNQAKDYNWKNIRRGYRKRGKITAKRELKNARKKKVSSWRKQDLMIAYKNFIFLM